MTVVVDRVLGNAGDPVWQQRLACAQVDKLMLDQWEAQKNRLRKTTVGGADIAVSLDRAVQLRDGDVLLWDPEQNTGTVVSVDLGEVMVIDLAPLYELGPGPLARTALELGHALGNQHWPAVIKGSRAFVPLTVDRKVTAAVMKTHAFPGVAYEFIAGSEVTPFLAPHEARRLFGGADSGAHSHAGGQ